MNLHQREGRGGERRRERRGKEVEERGGEREGRGGKRGRSGGEGRDAKVK